MYIFLFRWDKQVPALTSFAGAGCAASLAGRAGQWRRVARCEAWRKDLYLLFIKLLHFQIESVI